MPVDQLPGGRRSYPHSTLFAGLSKSGVGCMKSMLASCSEYEIVVILQAVSGPWAEALHNYELWLVGGLPWPCAFPRLRALAPELSEQFHSLLHSTP